MKIAVTYQDGMIFQHFGHSQFFKVYDVADRRILDSKVIATQGSGHGALAGFLSTQGVEALICGGIGAGAKSALADAHITLYCGAAGAADAAVLALLQGTLVYQPDIVCSHHEEGEGHHCHHDAGEEHHCHHDGDQK